MRKGVSVIVRGLLGDDTGPANTTSLSPRGSPCGVCHGPVGAGCVRREEMGSDTRATTSSALAAPSPPLRHRLPVTMCPTFLHVQSLPRTSLCEWTAGSASCRRDTDAQRGRAGPVWRPSLAGRPSEGPSPPRQLPHLRNCFSWGLRWDGGSRGPWRPRGTEQAHSTFRLRAGASSEEELLGDGRIQSWGPEKSPH